MPDTQVSAKRTIVVSAKSAEAGNWYYGFGCRGCSGKIAVFDDKSNGQEPSKMNGAGHLQVSCPHCSTDANYQSSEIVQFQAS